MEIYRKKSRTNRSLLFRYADAPLSIRSPQNTKVPQISGKSGCLRCFFCVCQGCTGSVYSGCSVMKSHSGWDAVSWQRVRMSWYRVGVRIPARYLWIPWWLSPPAKTGKPVFLCIDSRHVVLVFCPVHIPDLDAVRGVQCTSYRYCLSSMRVSFFIFPLYRAFRPSHSRTAHAHTTLRSRRSVP